MPDSFIKLSGVLNIHKPAGITSRRVVDRVQNLVRPQKAGHAGTLDPLATGVVGVCVGTTPQPEQLARAGKHVELEPRPVTVYRMDIVRYDDPQLVVDVECSRGTYVRSLGRDLAESLGTGAVMSALVRTAVGSFHVDDAVPLDAITSDSLGELTQPSRAAVAELPTVELTDEQLQDARHGRAFLGQPVQVEEPKGADIAALDSAGNLAAIVQAIDSEHLKPIRVFFES